MIALMVVALVMIAMLILGVYLALQQQRLLSSVERVSREQRSHFSEPNHQPELGHGDPWLPSVNEYGELDE